MSPKNDDIDFAELRQMAMRYARTKGVWDEALCEDFGQEYCLAIFLGQHSSLAFQLVNFLRKIYGRTDKRSLTGQAKSLALRTMKSYNEE